MSVCKVLPHPLEMCRVRAVRCCAVNDDHNAMVGENDLIPIISGLAVWPTCCGQEVLILVRQVSLSAGEA